MVPGITYVAQEMCLAALTTIAAHLLREISFGSMRLLAFVLLPAVLFADPISTTQNVIQVDPSGGHIDITFSAPVYGFNLDAYYYSTYDKGACLSFTATYTCLHGLLPSNHILDPLPPGVTGYDFLFSVNSATLSTSAVLYFMAQSAGDEMDPPHLAFSNFVTTGLEQIPTSTPEPGTMWLAAGAILALVIHTVRARRYRSGFPAY